MLVRYAGHVTRVEKRNALGFGLKNPGRRELLIRHTEVER
jgi:hypothetical protein